MLGGKDFGSFAQRSQRSGANAKRRCTFSSLVERCNARMLLITGLKKYSSSKAAYWSKNSSRVPRFVAAQSPPTGVVPGAEATYVEIFGRKPLRIGLRQSRPDADGPTEYPRNATASLAATRAVYDPFPILQLVSLPNARENCRKMILALTRSWQQSCRTLLPKRGRGGGLSFPLSPASGERVGVRGVCAHATTAIASISTNQSGTTSAATPTSVLAGGCALSTYMARTSRIIGTCSALRPTT